MRTNTEAWQVGEIGHIACGHHWRRVNHHREDMCVSICSLK